MELRYHTGYEYVSWLDYKVGESLGENELRVEKMQKIVIRNFHNNPQIATQTTE